MKQKEIRIGGVYIAKVSDQLTRVRIDAVNRHGGWDAVNLATKKRVHIKSAQRLRGKARDHNGDDEHCTTAGCGGPADIRRGDVWQCNACHKADCDAEEAGEVTAVEDVDAVEPQTYPGGVERTGYPPRSELTAEEAAKLERSRALSAKRAEVEAARIERARLKAERDAARADETNAKAAKRLDVDRLKADRAAVKAAKAAQSKRLSALDAAAQVLRERGGAMHCTELVQAMAESGLWDSPAGKTPAATLYSAILREIATKLDRSRFRKADRGKFECCDIAA